MAELLALTVKQPVAYLAGVLAGDGYLTKPAKGRPHGYLGLHVLDEDFARAFAEAIRLGYGVTANVTRESTGHWRAQKYGGFGRFDNLEAFRAEDDEQHAAWVRGFFDAEGNANLTAIPARGPSSWARRVSFYNTDMAILETARVSMAALQITTSMHPYAPSAGHLGRKTVYEILVKAGQSNYGRFAAVVGSSIPRKQATLEKIVSSYHPDIHEARRQAQASGAATKRARALEVRLPNLLREVARLTAKDGNPGYDRLSKMDGYWSARRTLGLAHAEIVRMARDLEGDLN